MANPIPERNATTAVIADVEVSKGRSYVDWAAVIAGALIATALSLLLTLFGSSIGLFAASPWSQDGVSAETLGIIAVLWFAFTNIYSIAVGAYFAGRMRPRVSDYKVDEVSFRDGANGLVVWALSLLIAASLAASIGSSVANLATQTATTAARGAAEMVAPVADEATDTLWREFTSQPQQGQQPAPEPGAAPTQPGATPTEQAMPTDAERQEIMRILRRGLTAGEIREEDRTYLAQLLERKTGMTPEQAQQRIQTTVTEAVDRAKSTVEAARRGAAFAGFWASIILLLSGVAAWWAGGLGGTHRDESLIAR